MLRTKNIGNRAVFCRLMKRKRKLDQRNKMLLEERYNGHPLRAEIKSALEVAERFADKAAAIRQDKNLSAEGRTNATESALRSALRDVMDSGAKVTEMRSRLNEIQASIKSPAFDKMDVSAALGRQEIRAALRGMSLADRAALLVGDGADPRFVEAVLEQPAMLSGTPKELYERVLTERLETLFSAQIAQGEELDQQIEEANAGLQTARQDLAKSSGLLDHEFDALATSVESKRNAPWLKKSTDAQGNVTVEVVPLQGGAARIAGFEDLRDGKYYRDFAEYQADRAAA
jgi:hypothetical protein